MAPTRQERKESVTRLRKQQILGAAFQVFSTKGFAAATTAEIAGAAGVAEGTIYNYFPTKRELFITVIRESIITPSLLELIEKLPEGNIPGILALILKNRFELIDTGVVQRMPVLMSDVIKDQDLCQLWVTEFLHPFLNKMQGIFDSLGKTGVYRDIDSQVAVRAIGGMVLGFLLLKTMEGDLSPLNEMPPEKVSGSIIDLLLHGLMKDKGQG